MSREELPETPSSLTPNNESQGITKPGGIPINALKTPNISQAASHFHSGPLPLPSIFQGYEQVLPGSADRILAMAEKEQAHRFSMEAESLKIEAESLKSEEKIRSQGSRFGLAVALVGMIGATWLGVLGRTVESSIMSGGTLVSLVTVFMKGSSESEKQSNESRDDDE